MRTTLIGAGYEVDDAKTGEEALEKVREFRPDLVLLDINMPGMGGWPPAERCATDTNIAIIMLTVRNTEEDKVEALDAGADDFVMQTVQHARTSGPHTCCASASARCTTVIAGKDSLWQPCDRLCRADGDER